MSLKSLWYKKLYRYDDWKCKAHIIHRHLNPLKLISNSPTNAAKSCLVIEVWSLLECSFPWIELLIKFLCFCSTFWSLMQLLCRLWSCKLSCTESSSSCIIVKINLVYWLIRSFSGKSKWLWMFWLHHIVWWRFLNETMADRMLIM